ncbi:MAG: T9SS type A sorting domain-containing protein [Bacteroidia bacterium]|nr:T9SS type A sorting domain-containing protein [Bacteroidia bacterium]
MGIFIGLRRRNVIGITKRIYENNETISLANNALAAGVYVVKVSSEGRSSVKKFIRQ